MTAEQFDALATYVEDELQFATSHYNDSYLERRFASRMRRCGVDDYEAYLRYLEAEDEEGAELLDALSINVTGFFRNPDVWDGIRERLQTLFEENDGDVRAWSAACADGREPYSLSMLAHDDVECDPTRLEILATDINEQSLDTAREGVYHNTRTIDVGEQLEFLSDYEEFVDRDGDQFRMGGGIREPISFERHDLINDRPKADFDLVICRNLFIYIDNEYKESVLETLAQSMREGGVLVIGKAETIPPQLQASFEVDDGRLRIYERV